MDTAVDTAYLDTAFPVATCVATSCLETCPTAVTGVVTAPGNPALHGVVLQMPIDGNMNALLLRTTEAVPFPSSAAEQRL
jgi:hypothetical protein